MISCRRCLQRFMSLPAYGIHTWMVKEVGMHHKKVCPDSDALKAQGMSLYSGQWVFLSPEMEARLPPQDRSTRIPNAYAECYPSEFKDKE